MAPRSPLEPGDLDKRIVGLSYVATLIITRELGRADLSAIAAVRAKRGQGGEP